MRYFFHLDDNVPNNDLESIDLPDLEAAKAELTKLCGEILADAGAKFWANPDWRVRVTDETGRLVLQIEIRGEATF
jgi:hypothetical protein